MLMAYIDPGTGMVVTGVGGFLIAFFFGFLGIFSMFFKRILGFLKKHIKPVLVILCIIIITGLVILGVIMNSNRSAFDGKMVIIGFDGLSPAIMEPMMEKGELPNFTRLKEKGGYKRLSSTNPSQSPVAWTAFSTGQNPGKNGVFDFIVRDPENYKLSLSLSKLETGKPERVVRSKCFWQYTSESKVPTVIITCPVTFPPDKIYGRMLSGMGVPDILGTEGTREAVLHLSGQWRQPNFAFNAIAIKCC
jgi:predicted AlkP superfamily pyrophosphatase or phosphodiesterase